MAHGTATVRHALSAGDGGAGGVLRRARLARRRGRDRSRRPRRARAALRRRSSPRRRRWPSTGRGRRASRSSERDVQDRPGQPDAVLARAQRVAFRPWAVEFGSALMGRPVEFWYDQFLAKPPGNGAADLLAPGRGLLGPEPRRPRHHRAGCRSTTSTSATAACTSSTAVTATASSSTASPSTSRATCLLCSPDESRTVACPIRLGARDVPPRQDAAHDDGQHRPTHGAAS